MCLQCAAWLGKSPTCRRHVGPTAKSRHIWPTGPRRADTISFPTHFCVSGIADFLQIFSKYQRYIRSNHRTNWYINIKQSVQPGYFFAPLTYYIILSTQSRNILLYQETASHNIASHNFCRRLIHINQYQDECSSSAPCWSCYSK